MRQERLDFGCEPIPAGHARVIKRLLAYAVPGKEESFLSLVPEREREHSVESLKTLGTPLVVRDEENLRVTVRLEPSPEVLELTTQGAMVVDLAVVGEDRCTGEMHGLVTMGKVDDAE